MVSEISKVIMDKKNNTLLIGLMAAVLGLGIWVAYLNATRSKIVFVDSVRLFEEYGMKKDLQKKLDIRKASVQKILDSMKIDLKVRYESMVRRKVKDGTPEAIEYMKSEQIYFMKEKEYNEDIETASAEYTSQVWKQLNQYMKEYGDQNSIDFIFGAKGDGNLMHARPSVDVTEDVLKFVNAKYEGDSK